MLNKVYALFMQKQKLLIWMQVWRRFDAVNRPCEKLKFQECGDASERFATKAID